MAPSRASSALHRFVTSATQPQARLRAPPHTMHDMRSAYVRTCNRRPISTLCARTQTQPCIRPPLITTGQAQIQTRSRAPKASPITPQTQTRTQTQSCSYSSQSADNAADAVEPPDYLNEKELHVFNKIKAELEPVRLEVQDISGGCGSMYALSIESPKFKGLSIVKQHKLVNSVLAEEISGWHGVQLKTKSA